MGFKDQVKKTRCSHRKIHFSPKTDWDIPFLTFAHAYIQMIDITIFLLATNIQAIFKMLFGVKGKILMSEMFWSHKLATVNVEFKSTSFTETEHVHFQCQFETNYCKDRRSNGSVKMYL